MVCSFAPKPETRQENEPRCVRIAGCALSPRAPSSKGKHIATRFIVAGCAFAPNAPDRKGKAPRNKGSYAVVCLGRL